MPFVLVDLGAFAVAGLCLLAAVALTYIIKAMASALPNLSILGVGLNLAKIFRDAGDDIVSWIVDNTKQFWHDIEGWVLGHAYLLDSAFGAVVQAIVTHAGFIAHIVTEVVPNAIRATESYVGRELVSLRNTVEGDIRSATTKVEHILDGDVRALYSTISTDVSTLEGDITRAVTKGVATAEHYADDAIGALRAYVDRSVADAETLASRALADARTQIGVAIAGVAATAAHDLAGAENSLEAEINAAARTAAQDLAGAERTIGTEITGAEAQAKTALQQAVGALTGEITGAERELEGQIGQAVGTLTGDITGQAQAFTGDLSHLQTVLQAAIAASMAGVIARVAKLEECSVGVCSDSPNNFGSLLKDALGLADLAGVGVFLAEVIDHPATAETAYKDTIEGLYSTGRSAFDTLLSL